MDELLVAAAPQRVAEREARAGGQPPGDEAHDQKIIVGSPEKRFFKRVFKLDAPPIMITAHGDAGMGLPAKEKRLRRLRSAGAEFLFSANSWARAEKESWGMAASDGRGFSACCGT